jgi:2,4-didehydro-3-deoxy-L-rhamnonate hydrolase
MKFVTFEHNGQTRIGLLHGESSVIDLSKADPTLPGDMLSFLRGFPATFETAKRFSARADLAVPISEVILKAPVQGMEKVIGIGLNYRDHAIESGMAIPTTPVFFTKFPSCVIGPNDTILIPPVRFVARYRI